jgi:hypothetical protein
VGRGIQGASLKVAISMTILVAIATLLLFTPLPPPLTQGNVQSNKPEVAVASKSVPEQNNSPRGHSDFLNTVLACIGVVVSSGTLILVWRQIQVMRGVERAQVDLDFVPAGTYSYIVKLSNHGKSIAIITSYSFIHAAYPILTTQFNPDEALKKFEDGWAMYAMLAPNTKSRDWLTHDLRQFLGEETVKRPDLKIVISGVVEYIDIFGKRHETEVVYHHISQTPARVVPLWEYGRFE